MKIRRRFFTLLEVVIALFILVLIGTVSTVQVAKLIQTHRFESEISTLFTQLQEAQLLASAYQTDIALDIRLEKGQWIYQFSTQEPFSPLQLNRKPQTLPHIAKAQFKDQKATLLHFDIFSGRLEPRGILAFFQTDEENGKALWFDLQYGQLIKFSSAKPPLLREHAITPH